MKMGVAMAFVSEVQALSVAQSSFELGAVPQVTRLLEIHALVGGSGRGRRHNLEILNKSAVVLTCAYWEAFVEDLAAETLSHLAEYAESASVLPEELRRSLAKKIVKDKHELAPWSIADDGWRALLRQAAARISHVDDQTLSSPTSQKVNDFFRTETGISGLAASWTWPGVSARGPQRRLDEFVKLRNAIAHRGGPSTASVTKKDATAALRLIERIAGCSLAYVNLSLERLVGKKLIPDPVPIEFP